MNENITLDFSLFDGFPDMCFLINDSGDIRFYNRASSEKLEINNGKSDIFFDYVELCDRNETQNLFINSRSRIVSGLRLFPVASKKYFC